MKSSAFYFIVLTFFIVGLLVSAYLLYSLPISLEEGSPAITPAVIAEVSPELLKLNVSIGITLLSGIYCIFSLYLRGKKAQVVEKIVYVDKSQERESEEKDLQENDEESKAKIREIEQAIQQKRTFNTKC